MNSPAVSAPATRNDLKIALGIVAAVVALFFVFAYPHLDDTAIFEAAKRGSCSHAASVGPQSEQQSQACLQRANAYTYSITRDGGDQAKVTLFLAGAVWDKVTVARDSSGNWNPVD